MAKQNTPTPGIPALREAVQQKLQRENRLEFAVADIIIANGAKQVIFMPLPPRLMMAMK